MRKIINSATTQYEPLLTEELVLDDRPISGSFNGITSDAVYKAISVDPGNVPPVESTDDGKVLTASYGEGGGSFEWAEAQGGSDLPEYSSTEVGKVLGVVADYENITDGQPATILDWVDQPAPELPAQLGTAGQVLTVNSGATGVEWATPSGGGGSDVPSYTASDLTKVLTVAGNSGSQWLRWDPIWKSMTFTEQDGEYNSSVNYFKTEKTLLELYITGTLPNEIYITTDYKPDPMLGTYASTPVLKTTGGTVCATLQAWINSSSNHSIRLEVWNASDNTLVTGLTISAIYQNIAS